MAQRYKTIDINKTETGTRYIQNAIYPKIPESDKDFYVIATAGDRYDTLASQFYQDQSLWWIIASANNSSGGTFIPTPGEQIRIPADVENALTLFEQVNRTR